jgi:co-chaperonin GroES (HSP10)
MKRLTPVGPRIIVEPIKGETVEGRIAREIDLIVPDQYKERYEPRATTGMIIAIGEGLDTLFTIGEVVTFKAFAGTPFVLEGKDLIILDDKDVLGKLEEE